MNPLLLMLLLGGNLGNLFGGGQSSGLSGILPLMLMGGGTKALSNPLTMMGLATGNTQLATMGAVTQAAGTGTTRRYRRSWKASAMYWKGRALGSRRF